MVMTAFVSVGCFIISSALVSMESPSLMMICLLFQTILVVLLVGWLKSVWYSYILFLVFLGGLLILFVYISSLISSEKSEFSYSNWKLLSGLSVLWVCIFFFMTTFSSKVGSGENFNYSLPYLINNLTSSWGSVLYVFIILYLLLTLYCVCWLLKVFEGPLRLLS